MTSQTDSISSAPPLDTTVATTPPEFTGFESHRIGCAPGIDLAAWIGGSGPPLLLLHGHPQTHFIWHALAAPLSRHYTVVMTDLRGYGDSSKPKGEPDHANYSKRSMALDQLTAMSHFGYSSFMVCAHDRGARVAHRLCLDFSAAVQKALLLDIAPTLHMYEQVGRDFAQAYFHWFFLIQPAPFPERMISADPDAYIDAVMGQRSAGWTIFTPAAQQAYRTALSTSGAAHALCEDYRAAASIDLDHDRHDRDQGHKVQCPLRVLWGERGIIGRLFNPQAAWEQVAQQVTTGSLPAGHYIPEEVPDLLFGEIRQFLI